MGSTGIVAEVKEALKIYTDSKSKNTPTLKAEKALLKNLNVLRGLFHGINCSKFKGTSAEVLALLPTPLNHLLGL